MTRYSSVPLLAAAVLSLGGCATVSFAPPSVNLVNAMETRGSNRSLGQSCQPFEKGTVGNRVRITEDVDGARALIDNFVLMYRCRAHSAANGRQMFEVPSFLTAVGGVTAIALGAGPDVALATGAATSVLNGGKGYYAPKDKAKIFDGSLDALLCIKTEAVGVAAFDAKVDAKWNAIDALIKNNDTSVEVPAEKQYFDMVSASLLSVERILAQRLSNSGTFDPAGIIAEIEKLTSEEEKAATPEANAALAEAEKGLAGKTGVAFDAALNTVRQAKAIISIPQLQPKLQKCVVRAKL
jgi:hypothetical protein